LGGFGSKRRACAAVPVMPVQRQAPEGLFAASLLLSRPGYPRVAAAPCRAWVPAFISGSRAADEKFPPRPPAPSHQCARPVG
jgi:hypothetical protein